MARKNIVYLAILLVLVIVDASLLADPEPKGNVTLFVINSQAVRTFLGAFLTAGGTIAICLLVAYLIRRFLSRRLAYAALLACLALSAYVALQVFVYFTHAQREDTLGTEFVAGSVLLGVIMMIVFGKESFGVTQNRDSRPSTQHL